MGWSYARKGVIVVDLEIMPLKHGIERDTQVQLCKVTRKLSTASACLSPFMTMTMFAHKQHEIK